ncbi:transposable element Tcb2 transposase [Trichonephila clavipes]|nr:transposable element Tcb2 transposase [Trichonephila clavipes]
MKAGGSARQADRQLSRSGCVMRKFWDQWIREMSFTRRPGSGRPRPTSHREVRPIAPVSSRTIRTIAEGSPRPFHVISLMSPHRHFRLEWCRARGNWTAAEWNQIVFSDESRFNLSSDDNRVREWRPRGERFNPDFTLQRHTAPTAGVPLPTIHGHA